LALDYSPDAPHLPFRVILDLTHDENTRHFGGRGSLLPALSHRTT
jgi:hypothetical protein